MWDWVVIKNMKTQFSQLALIAVVSIFPLSAFASGHQRGGHSGRSSSPARHAPAPRVHHAPRVHAPAPRVHVPAPRVHVPAPRVHVPAPRVHVHAPRVHVPAPRVHVHAPRVHIPVPPVVVAPPVVVVPTRRWVEGYHEQVWVDGTCKINRRNQEVCRPGRYKRVWRPGYYETIE
ncbi:MAG: hypothetical protein FWG75_09720 [Cystobacterineae bacterium]|nr:hypothetical protein [Cystobacterineae bacterium]